MRTHTSTHLFFAPLRHRSVSDLFRFNDDEIALLDRTFRLLHDRYFGIPTTATVVRGDAR